MPLSSVKSFFFFYSGEARINYDDEVPITVNKSRKKNFKEGPSSKTKKFVFAFLTRSHCTIPPSPCGQAKEAPGWEAG